MTIIALHAVSMSAGWRGCGGHSFDVENVFNTLNNFWCVSLSGKNLVEISAVDKQTGICVNKFNQIALLHITLEQFRLYAQTKFGKFA